MRGSAARRRAYLIFRIPLSLLAGKLEHVESICGRISVVRYPRYLGKYRDTTCDDTSIAKVTVNRGPTIP